jgi:hypothetical protein
MELGMFAESAREGSRVSTGRKWMALLVAPILGLLAMILPVLIRRPAVWYDAPMFPVLRNAQEHVGAWQLVLFFVAGLALGFLFSSRALLLGAAAVILLPLAAVAEMLVDPASHNLFPFEFLIYAAYGAIVATGSALAHRMVRRRRRAESTLLTMIP